MSVVGAIGRGLVATLGAPRLVFGLWLAGLLVALPASVAVGLSIGRSIGPSLVHRELRQGFAMGWYGEYRSTAEGLERSFRPTISGATAFYDNLEDWLTGRIFWEYPELVGIGVLYAVLWAFLLGGVLDRFAHPAVPPDRGRFARACGVHFFRFVRLALISGVLYLAIFALHGWTFSRLDVLLRDVTRETTVLTASLAGYLLTAFLLTLVHMGFDYAKIATVLEDRGGMLRAALRGFGFVFSHPLRTFGVYYGVLVLGGVALALYAALAPGAGQSSVAGLALAFLAGQLFLIVRLTLRLTLLAAQTTLYGDVSQKGVSGTP